jgi:hypothetical protein
LKNNTLTGSCEVGLLVALNSQSAAMGLGAGLSTKNTAYAITLGNNIAWSDVWYSHPAGSGNTLTVDGTAIENGSHAAYDAKGC